MITILLLGMFITTIPNVKADTHNANIPPGLYLYLIMQMGAGVQLDFTVTSSAYVDVYVFDETNYNQYIIDGTYSSALFTSTQVMTVSDSVTAQTQGKYYVIVANLNSNTTAIVAVDYQFIGPSPSGLSGLITAVLIGAILGGVAGGIGYFIRNSRKKKQIPPEFGMPPTNIPPLGPST
jgi:hypothetical protein